MRHVGCVPVVLPVYLQGRPVGEFHHVLLLGHTFEVLGEYGRRDAELASHESFSVAFDHDPVSGVVPVVRVSGLRGLDVLLGLCE
jgi:hypothetical protein